MPNLDQDFRDRTSPVWDMSQERLLTEQLVSQRFNFFLVLIGVVVAGALNARSQLHMQLVLSVGFLLAIVFTKALHRTSARLDAILEELREDPTHPFTIISAKVGGEGIRQTLWQATPAACTVLIGVAGAASWVGVLQAVQLK